MLGFVLLELEWRLPNDKDLFVLHVLAAISSLQDSLGKVLYLGLWALSAISVVKVD